MKKYFLTTFLLTSLVFFGQNKEPKVGLVLSGGGAKGFAHVGILKEIDKAGLQIDYIGGTSMGAIVGALYSVGYSGIEIEKIILETDFISLLRDQLPRSTKPFVEKEYGEKTVITLPFSDGKLGLPKAVSKGQNMLNLLNELFSRVETTTNFSDFQIPFFCVATNVETGKGVVLETGNLPLSLRASGSFPTLLNPVELKGNLLIDGGIANNFPSDIMRKKGADIIIGVDVQGKLFEKDKLNSVVAILNQIVSYKMYNKSNLNKQNIEVYIKPDISKYNVVDFNKKTELLKLGELTATKYKEVFKEIAKKKTTKTKRKKIQRDLEKIKIDAIKIIGAKKQTEAYVLGKLNLKVGDNLSRKDITKRIYALSATNNYDRIEYAFNNTKNNKKEILINLKESSKKPTLELGLHYDRLYESALLAKYTQESVITKNDVFSFNAILGDRLRYNLNYFVDNGFNWSYGFRSRYNNFRANTKFNDIFADLPNINAINIDYTDFTNQFFIQTTFDRKFALGLGLEHKKINITTETILNNNEPTVLDNSDYFSLFGYLKLDTYDKRYFVTKGYFADLGFKWYFNSTDYNNDFKSFGQAKGTLGFATTLFKRLTFQNTNEAGFTIDSPDSGIFDFYLGGLQSKLCKHLYFVIWV